MLRRKTIYEVIVEFKNGDIEHLKLMSVSLYTDMYEAYDLREIERLKTITKDRKGNVLGYHIFYDSELHKVIESGKIIRIRYDNGKVLTGNLDYFLAKEPYYTFRIEGYNRGERIKVELIQEILY